MKSCQLLIAVVVTCVLCMAAKTEAASISISIDGVNSPPVPLEEVPKPGGGSVFIIGSEEEPFMFETANGRVILGGELDPDPSILFGGLTFDFGAPSVFSFTFILPLSPTVTNPSFVKDSFSGSVTNAAGSGVTVTALAPPAGIPTDGDGITEMQVYTLSDDGGVTWKNVGLDLGPTAIIPLPVGDSDVYGSFNEGFISTIAGGAWTHMRADVNFSLSGDGDVFSFNGAKLLVPEPGALAMLLVSLVMCCLGRRLVVR